MKPIDPRLVSRARATARYILLVVALAIFATLSTVTIAWSFANFVVAIFASGQSLVQAQHFLLLSLLAAGLRALAHFAQEWVGFWAAGKVKLDLREQALDVIEKGGSDLVGEHGSAELSQLLGPSLDSLDIYFAKYLPQLVYTALITPALTALIWFMDAPSGISVLLTLPLIPLFLAMIGYATKDLQDSQLAALERLNGHYLEIVKGLVTLKLFGRVQMQKEILREVSEQFRTRTMKVLRVSFLSGFALELAASLSVALIAVSIGLRLVDGKLALFTGLFILIIAPEVYLPLRNVGAQFHAAAQGVSVSKRVLDFIEAGPVIRKSATVLETNPGLTAVTGPSGSGKTIALRALIESGGVWMPQRAVLFPGTIKSNIAGPGAVDPKALRFALDVSQLGSFDVETVVSEQDGLSGGQRQRVSLARAIYRLQTSGKTLLLLDEPTSQLDNETASAVIHGLVEMAKLGISVVAVTHSDAVISSADRVVRIG
jgi:ATP-binding cassette subfamily C protein CydD